MSVRSDVGIAMNKEAHGTMMENYPDLMNELISYSSSEHHLEEQVLIVLEHVKWYTDEKGSFAEQFMNAIRTLDSSTYHVVEVCSEYNQVDAEGNLEDVFDLHGVSIVELSFSA